jgi:hypothetical protein
MISQENLPPFVQGGRNPTFFSGESLPTVEKNIQSFFGKGIAFSKIHATMKLRFIHTMKHKQEIWR